MSVEELVKELREQERSLQYNAIEYGCVDSGIAANVASQAADKLEELAAALAEKDKEIVELREAVEPFSRLASVLCAGDTDDTIVIGVSAGDLRRLVNACCVREGGKSETCPECGGKGNAQPVASTNPA